jgi:uncharacterized membrane protein
VVVVGTALCGLAWATSVTRTGWDDPSSWIAKASVSVAVALAAVGLVHLVVRVRRAMRSAPADLRRDPRDH